MKLRKKDPWKSAKEYSKDLSSLTINLLVKDVKLSKDFAEQVLNARIVYHDADFVAIEGYGSRWCLHAYHTYDTHPLMTLINQSKAKGVGVELRLIGCDPDEAEKRAKENGFRILAKSADKPHGMRETYIIDGDDYCWVPCIKITNH